MTGLLKTEKIPESLCLLLAFITNYEKSSQDLNPESLDFTGDLIHL